MESLAPCGEGLADSLCPPLWPTAACLPQLRSAWPACGLPSTSSSSKGRPASASPSSCIVSEPLPCLEEGQREASPEVLGERAPSQGSSSLRPSVTSLPTPALSSRRVSLGPWSPPIAQAAISPSFHLWYPLIASSVTQTNTKLLAELEEACVPRNFLCCNFLANIS